MHSLAADVFLHLPKGKSIGEDQMDDDNPALDVHRNNENNLAVVCTVTRSVTGPRCGNGFGITRGNTHSQNIMKIVDSEPLWLINYMSVFCCKASWMCEFILRC